MAKTKKTSVKTIILKNILGIIIFFMLIFAIGNYVRDDQLSGKRTQVYVNPQTNQVIVSNRGTKGIQDVGTDIKLAFTGNSGLKETKRYKHSKKITEMAKEKYGTNDVTSVGHSLGGKLSQLTNDKAIMVNAPTLLTELKNKDKPGHINIRAQADIVSVFNKRNKKPNNFTIGSSNSLIGGWPYYLGEHSYDVLKRDDAPDIKI